MGLISVLSFVLVVTVGCQLPLYAGLDFEKHEDKWVIVKIPESQLPSIKGSFEQLNMCNSMEEEAPGYSAWNNFDLVRLELWSNDLEEKKDKALKLSLSAKVQGQVYLLDNMISDLKSTEWTNDGYKNCEQLDEIRAKYLALEKVHQTNGNHFLQYFTFVHPQVKSEVERIEKNFGPLVVKKAGNYEERLVSSIKPWAGFWFPASSIEQLYRKNSPLYKLDKILKRQGLQFGAAAEEKWLFENLQGADGWEGHCHAWSVAAVSFPEPRGSKRIHRKKITIADQKSILTKVSALTPTEEYGIRYRGNWKTDGTYQDIIPQAFHQLLRHYLGNSKPIILDDDAGVEVWTKPVKAMISKYKIDPKVPNAILVKSWIELVKQTRSFNEANRRTDYSRDSASLVLEYRLYLGQTPDGAGNYRVVHSEWVGDAIESHPDILIAPKIEAPKSDNSVINKNLKYILENLVGKR